MAKIMLMRETPISYCQVCGWSDERYVNVCPKCGNTPLVHYIEWKWKKPNTTYIQ